MPSRNVTVIGLQWGDEGKGKIVDALAGVSQYVVRFCGGANAGHTVQVGEETFALHLIPSGILHKDVVNVVGNGVAFDPATALKEIDALRDRGVQIGPDNLRISRNAHVVMPYHKIQDSESEKLLGDGKIGTTARGIGPCYSDKTNRSTAIRAGDLLDPDGLADTLGRIVAVKNKIFTSLYQTDPLDSAQLTETYLEYGRRLDGMICDTGSLLRRVCREGNQRLLFEGGQGAMLDLDHGTFPFVTSSSVTACGIPTGAGVSPKQVGRVVGLIKAYTTRVGAGPFPTEQNNEVGDALREKGNGPAPPLRLVRRVRRGLHRRTVRRGRDGPEPAGRAVRPGRDPHLHRLPARRQGDGGLRSAGNGRRRVHLRNAARLEGGHHRLSEL
jgi:adenylosuccinate synthase